MDLEAAIAHGVSALAGAGGGGFFVRLIFKAWAKKQDTHDKALGKLTEAVIRLEERVKGLLDRDKSTDHAIKLAILEERSDKHGRDINGLGGKLREVTQ